MTPVAAGDDLSTLVQPAAVKFAEHLKLKLAEAQLLGSAEEPRAGISYGQYLSSNLQIPVWGEEGWEAVSVDFNDASPDLSYYFRPLDGPYSDATFSDISPDGSSTGTSFESGSEKSCEIGSIVEEQADEIEALSGLEANCQVYRQPATSPTLVRLGGQRRKRGATF
jgi:hypothetical protein